MMQNFIVSSINRFCVIHCPKSWAKHLLKKFKTSSNSHGKQNSTLITMASMWPLTFFKGHGETLQSFIAFKYNIYGTYVRNVRYRVVGDTVDGKRAHQNVK